jgi:hypothetical protein
LFGKLPIGMSAGLGRRHGPGVGAWRGSGRLWSGGPPGGGAGSSLGGRGRFGPGVGDWAARDPYVAVAAHHLGGRR